IHYAYVAAGAACLVTNSFQANPQALARHGLASGLEDIGSAAVRLAREAGGPETIVLASVGPWTHPDIAATTCIAHSLQDADGYLLETWSDDSAGRVAGWLADRAVNPRSLPVLVSFTYRGPATAAEKLELLNEAEKNARMAEQAGVATLGVNCGRDLDLTTMAEILRVYRRT